MDGIEKQLENILSGMEPCAAKLYTAWLWLVIGMIQRGELTDITEINTLTGLRLKRITD